MIKILFICHGNICRSPMAEFVMKDIVARAGLSKEFDIASAATSSEEIWNGVGNPVYPPAKAKLMEHGIDCSGKRAVQLTCRDYGKYDYLIGMETANIRNMFRILGADPDGKIHKLLSFAGSDRDISDPWYTGDFETTYRDVREGCTALMKYLMKQREQSAVPHIPADSVQAVIFDLDGTLIDTEKYYRVFWPKALSEFGYQMSDEQALAMRSLGRPFAIRQLKDWFGEELDYQAVRSRRKMLMEEYLDRVGIERKPGARELMDFLRERKITTAVATASDLERTEKYLKQVGLEGWFDSLISATMVKEGNPAPDIYRYACSRLGKAPETCIAVEDSPNGVLSAYRAGCRVIMVPDQTQPDEALSQCLMAKMDSLLELREWMKGNEGKETQEGKEVQEGKETQEVKEAQEGKEV